jgi:hypothetical protein
MAYSFSKILLKILDTIAAKYTIASSFFYRCSGDGCVLWRGPLDKLSLAAAAVERNDSGVGSDSGLSVSYPKLPSFQEKTTDGATCRECDAALLAAAAGSQEQSGDCSGGGVGSGSLCNKCSKRKGERKEIIRFLLTVVSFLNFFNV